MKKSPARKQIKNFQEKLADSHFDTENKTFIMVNGALATSLYKDTLLYGLSKVIPGLAGLLSVVIFFQWVGSETYGEYSLMFSQFNLLAALGFGWLNQAILRYKYQDRQEIIFRPTLFYAFSLSTLFIILVSFGAQLVNLIRTVHYSLSLICILSIAVFNLIKVNYQANLLPQQVIKITSYQAILALLIPISLMIFFARSSSLILLGVTLAFLTVNVGVLSQRSRLLIIFQSVRTTKVYARTLLKKWFRFSYPLSIWFTAGLALPFLDRFFINQYLSPLELGSYAGLHELLIRFFSLVLFPITMALHPQIMTLWNASKNADAISLLKIGVLSQLGIFIMIFIPIFIFNNTLFSLIQNSILEIPIQFQHLIIPLFITGFLWQFSFLTHKILEIKERTFLMVIFILLSLIINIVGNTVFIPQYGVIATAYTAMLSALSYCTLTIIASLRILKEERAR